MPATCPHRGSKTPAGREGRGASSSCVASKQVVTTGSNPNDLARPPTAVCPHPTFSSMPSRSPRRPHDRAAPGAPGRSPAPAPHAARRRVTPATPPRARRAGALPRSASETALWTRRSASDGRDDDDDGSTGGLQILPRHYTCTDLCPTAAGLPFSHSPPSPLEGGCNGRDAKWEGKVLVTVAVEGSPGPVRAIVRLGATVEEAIGAVVGVYGREGRSPKLNPAAVPSFQLHHNHFCLQSLNKGDTLGQVGGRNFYLRRSRGAGEATAAMGGQEVGIRPLPLVPVCSNSLLAIVAGRLSKIGRKLKKLWRALGCATCG